jgi:hypothetical protein
VLQFLIAVLHCVVVMLPVFVAHVQAYKSHGNVRKICGDGAYLKIQYQSQ